ncbi:MAG TPA: hypothetical protein VNL71_25465 [Chloroflexota bacterium]|nr:hypothetical protein [Chloroflexota bacterium]
MRREIPTRKNGYAKADGELAALRTTLEAQCAQTLLLKTKLEALEDARGGSLARSGWAPSRVLGLAAVGCMGILALGTDAFASGPVSRDTIHACYITTLPKTIHGHATPQTPAMGTLRLVNPSKHQGCVRGETAISWNQIGPMGLQGREGALGIRGPIGATGPVGPTGRQGLAGPRGVPGPGGPRGWVGPKGVPGPQGPMGADGPQGPAGPVGTEGAMGVSGPTGPAGATGAAGVTGTAGATGSAGTPGLNWRGNWSPATSYASNDAALFGGSSWIATAANTGNPPHAGSAQWNLLAEGLIAPAATVTQMRLGSAFSVQVQGSGFPPNSTDPIQVTQGTNTQQGSATMDASGNFVSPVAIPGFSCGSSQSISVEIMDANGAPLSYGTYTPAC